MLETMTGSLDRLLGFVVADPEMSGDAVNHDPLHCVGAGLPLGCQFLDGLAEPIRQAGPSARTLGHKSYCRPGEDLRTGPLELGSVGCCGFSGLEVA
jgi:hypothetical protein